MIDMISNSQACMGCIGTVFTIGVVYWYFIRKKPPKIKKAVAIMTETRDTKLLLVVRTDLKMGKGKAAAQCCHATVAAYEQSKSKQPHILTAWKKNGQPKIVVKIDTEEEMLKLADEARNYGLLANLVRDAGRTQIAPGSKTVLAIGPGPVSIIDDITGHLKLY